MQKLVALALSALCHGADAGTTIYDQWYSVASGGTIDSAYNEKLEDRDGKFFFQVKTWRKTGNQISEESVGGLSAGDETLAPQFFNFHAVKEGQEISVDANFQGRLLVAKTKRGEKVGPPLRKMLPPGVILSNFFPVLLKSRLEKAKPGVAMAFNALLEDAYDKSFPIVPGTFKRELPDTYAKEKNAIKFTVKFAGMTNIWWVDEKGSAIRIEIPAANVKVERVTQAQADQFLKAIGASQ